jgi:putative transcriptional regulator
MIRNHLSRILGERRISQKRLSEITDLRPSTVNAIYNERASRIDYDVLDRLCKALDCQPGDILEHVPDSLDKTSEDDK